ncbi:MAG: hypothetical protein JKX83_02850 [Pseudomonadales bacterium]|nr:hypothetical protein [Pseudomonadales bacterium]
MSSAITRYITQHYPVVLAFKYVFNRGNKGGHLDDYLDGDIDGDNTGHWAKSPRRLCAASELTTVML